MAVMIELSNGETAVLKGDDELTNREVKSMQKASQVAASVVKTLEDLGYKEDDPEAWRVISSLPPKDYDAIDIFQRTCVIIRLKSWTLDRPLPTTADEVDDLPMSIYTPLTVAAVDINFDQKMDNTLEAQADPKAVTANSAN
jgi:hypothetical protein